jgi:hypothetical protein
MARKINPLPPLELLHTLFTYDDATGLLVWRKSSGTARAGREAGWLHQSGYVYVGVQGRSYKVHRVVWYMHYGVQPEGLLDHIDRDPTNNRIANLRECTHAQNQQNKRTYANNHSGVKGVSWYPRYGKWRVRIQHMGTPILVGMYSDFEKACAARLDAQKKLHTHAADIF